MGEIFFFFADELRDITFLESLQILMNAMMESICVVFRMTEEQIEAFIELFINSLPNYIVSALETGSAAA